MDAERSPFHCGVVLDKGTTIPFFSNMLYYWDVCLCSNLCLRVCIPEGELDPDLCRNVLDSLLSGTYLTFFSTSTMTLDMHDTCVQLLGQGSTHKPFDPRVAAPYLSLETFETHVREQFPSLPGHAEHDTFRCPEHYVLGVDAVIDFPLIENILSKDGIISPNTLRAVAIDLYYEEHLRSLGVQVMIGAHVCWREPWSSEWMSALCLKPHSNRTFDMTNYKVIQRDEDYVVPVNAISQSGVIRVCLRRIHSFVNASDELFTPHILEAYMISNDVADTNVALCIKSCTETSWLLETEVAREPGLVNGAVHIRFAMPSHALFKHVVLV